MSLENTYGVPRETIKKMVRDGVISCSIISHVEVWDMYKSRVGKFDTLHEICVDISLSSSYQVDNIKKIIQKFRKNSSFL